MRRKLFWLGVLWCLGTPAVHAGDPPVPQPIPPAMPIPAPAPKPAAEPIPLPGQITVSPTIPGSSCADSASPGGKHEYAKAKLQEKINNHRRAPEGCPTPVGCGNWYTEFKYVFGSCRQFFGTGDASVGCLKKTKLPQPPYMP